MLILNYLVILELFNFEDVHVTCSFPVAIMIPDKSVTAKHKINRPSILHFLNKFSYCTEKMDYI